MNDTVLAVNKPAPDFSAPSFYKGAIDHNISLKDFRGKWVLLFFYPLDFTFVCPTELFELGEMQEEFEKENCQVLGVSVDSVYSHQAWAQADERVKGIGYPLISDIKKEISLAYDVLHDDGVSLRGAFIIDPDGVLQSIMINNLSVGRSAKELLRLVKAFKTGDLCPASWKKGDKTLG